MERRGRMLESALCYAGFGWPVVPLYSVDENGRCLCGKTDCNSAGKHPHSGLAPNGVKDATTEAETIRRWCEQDINIGICAGLDAGLIILDVDPAHGGNESLTKYDVPETLIVITGSGGTHYYFKHPGGAIKNSVGKLGAGLDVRAAGGYVVAPPSLHSSGSEYRWKIDPRAKKPAVCPGFISNKSDSKKPAEADSDAETIAEGKRNDTLTSLAGTLRRKGFSVEAMCAALVEENKKRCNPPLPDAEVRKIAESVSNYKPQPDHVSDEIILPNKKPQIVAQAFRKWSLEKNCVKHHHHIDLWTVFKDGKYKIVEESEVKKWIRFFSNKCRYRTAGGDKPLSVSTHIVNEIHNALTAEPGVWIRPRHLPPAWLTDDKHPELIIAMQNCLLDITSDEPRQVDLTEDYYTLNYLPFDYAPDARAPRWIKFTEEIFQKKQLSSKETVFDESEGDFVPVYEAVPDELSIQILQEFMGLLLTHQTKYQKILGIVGPRRSGKGTIGRVIRRLVGSENTAAPTLSTLTTEFGLQGLLNKTVALIGDASINGRGGDVIRAVERLKSISGEDPQQVNRKCRTHIEIEKLSVRFVIMANELQALIDPTGALASRFIFLITTQSFYGREDVDLEAKLIPEIPGIFNWALEGLKRLRSRGYFLESVAGKEAKAMAEELGSNVIAFVRDWCQIGEGNQIKCNELYSAYKRWVQDAGRGKLGRTKFYEEFSRAYSDCTRQKLRIDDYEASPVWVFKNIEVKFEYRESNTAAGYVD